jgi:hypothetical protein
MNPVKLEAIIDFISPIGPITLAVDRVTQVYQYGYHPSKEA